MSEYITINTEQNLVENFKLEPLPVYNENYPMLREIMPEVDVSTIPNAGLNKVIGRMKLSMKKYSGIGLSANQCGIRARIFIIGTDETNFVCINPKIIQPLSELVKMQEGCLSSPGLYVKVPRYNKIQVEYYDERGNLMNTIMEGVTAQCFQHELDHLNGVYYTQHVGEASLMLAKQKQSKLIKKYKRKK